MSTMEELLAQAEAAELETAVEEQPYVYSDKYLKRTQYVSDNAPIDIIAKEIQSMDGEISVKGEAISQYVEFRLDRYYDGIDLLGMLFNIHYEKDSYGGENRPVNVRYNDTKMILGWAIPNAAVKESGILNMCIWATGNLYDDTYVWKTKPKSYAVNDGLTIAENIAEPDDNWYVQFVNEIEAKIQEFSGRVDDIAQIEENLSADVQVINEKYDSIIASAETAGQSAASAQVSEQNAQLYKEQTQQIAEQVKEEASKVYKYQGSVPTYNDLPTANVSNGDVYNVESDGMNYAWDETNQRWDSLGIVIDLSKYSTTEQIELMLNQYVQKESGKGLFSGSYNDLSDKPNVNGIELSGNKTLDELDIASKTAFESLSENVSTNADGITNLNSNLSVLETNLGDLKKEEVDKKIESEVATDFSQADTPQFQQTIDDVQNEVSELKGDLSIIIDSEKIGVDKITSTEIFSVKSYSVYGIKYLEKSVSLSTYTDIYQNISTPDSYADTLGLVRGKRYRFSADVKVNQVISGTPKIWFSIRENESTSIIKSNQITTDGIIELEWVQTDAMQRFALFITGSEDCKCTVTFSNISLVEVLSKVTAIDIYSRNVFGFQNAIELGCKNDGTEDISAIINNYDWSKGLYFPQGEYLVSEPLVINGSIVGAGSGHRSKVKKGNGTTFICNANKGLYIPTYSSGHFDIRDIEVRMKVDGNAIDFDCNILKTTIHFQNISITELRNGYGLYVHTSKGFSSNPCYIDGITVVSDFAGIYSNVGIYAGDNIGDVRITNVLTLGCQKGIHISSSSWIIDNLHLWCGAVISLGAVYTSEWANNTCCLEFGNVNQISIGKIYTDTCAKAISINGESACVHINDWIHWDDKTTSSLLDGVIMADCSSADCDIMVDCFSGLIPSKLTNLYTPIKSNHVKIEKFHPIIEWDYSIRLAKNGCKHSTISSQINLNTTSSNDMYYPILGIAFDETGFVKFNISIDDSVDSIALSVDSTGVLRQSGINIVGTETSKYFFTFKSNFMKLYVKKAYSSSKTIPLNVNIEYQSGNVNIIDYADVKHYPSENRYSNEYALTDSSALEQINFNLSKQTLTNKKGDDNL